jgi:hypothetical protein
VGEQQRHDKQDQAAADASHHVPPYVPHAHATIIRAGGQQLRLRIKHSEVDARVLEGSLPKKLRLERSGVKCGRQHLRRRH